MPTTPNTLPDLAGKPRVGMLWQLPFPTDAAAKAIGRDLWQGAAWARHPVTRVEYVHVMQAQPSAKAGDDVEDTYVHRYRVTSTGLRYEGSMRCDGFGHCQTIHVRISIKGSHWVWVGAETYKAGDSTGSELVRALWRRGRINRASKNVQRIPTGSGPVGAVGSEDWTIVLRRPGSTVETYEWHSETSLRRHTSRAVRPRPTASLTVARGPGTFQSACATGTYKDAAKVGRVYRINGNTDQASVVHEFRVGAGIIRAADKARQALGRLDVTKTAPPGVRITSEEGEAIFVRAGRLVVGKRFNSVARRVVAFFTVSP